MALDPDVRRFIAAHIDDVESLELLLLLERKRSSWTPKEAADELGLAPALVGDRLAHLCAIGLVTSETGERFIWASANELAGSVAKLAIAYRAKRREVLDEVSASSPLESFSEAFRLRRRKNDDD